MDDFKKINEDFGHDAGDEVMRAYLVAARDALEMLGSAYRGRGDETVSIIVGQGQLRAREIAEDMCERVRSISIEYNGQLLPKVTASIGVTTSPPNPRSRDLNTIADGAARKAKDIGKNRVEEG